MLSRRAFVVVSMVSFAKRAADGVAAKRQGKAGLFAPPLAEIEHLLQAFGCVGELPLVDDESGVELAGEDGGDDLVKGDGDGLDLGSEELERKICRRQGAGDGDLDLLDLVERELTDWRRSWDRSHRRRCRRRPSGCTSPAYKGRRETRWR
jgi:hypothetical protein